MRKKLFQIPIITFCITLIFISCSQKDTSILNETFDNNTRGWIEEISNYHSVYFDDGKYYVESKDTSSATFRSSSGSLDKSYLYALPNKYEIESKIGLVEHELEGTFFGLLLYGATYEYSFNFYESGIVEVLEYNHNSRQEYQLFADTSDYKFENEIQIKISVDSTDFRLFIEDYEIGNSKFEIKGLQDLRLFTSKQSKISIDYLTIEEVK